MGKKLPTTFKSLDLSGFDLENEKQKYIGYTGISREMLDIACAVLQKNNVGVVVRSVNAALKEIYGVGGSTDVICKLLKEWRSDNLSFLKEGKSEKDLATVLMEAADDGLLEDSEIPEDFLAVARQMALATYRLAFQKADSSVSGDRMKQLAQQNEILQQQLQAFPKLEMELEFYKAQYNRQCNELKEAYINLNKQKLTDSEEFRQQLDSLQADRNELQAKLTVAERRLAEIAEFEAAARDRISEISKLNGQIEAREREVSTLHVQIQNLQSEMGQKQVLESQLEQLRGQLKEASTTITYLQTQQKVSGALQVDRPFDSDDELVTDAQLMVENETLHADLSDALKEIEDLKAALAKTQAQLSENKRDSIDSSTDSPTDSSSDVCESLLDQLPETWADDPLDSPSHPVQQQFPEPVSEPIAAPVPESVSETHSPPVQSTKPKKQKFALAK
jgi:myosin heavy subunit